MPVAYAREVLNAQDYIACVGATSLGETRPLGNPDRIQAMMDKTADIVGHRVAIVLLSKPPAEGFYRAIGMTQPMSAFMRPRTDRS